MKAFKKGLAVLMVLAMAITSMVAFDVTTTSAKVKSVKATKKVTVDVGKTKTVKVTVKTTGKTSKAFTVKASKKGIVKVTKKKGQIKIKGLKAGKVKLTIKSKANKKKKKTITVTVVKPSVKPDVNTDITMDVNQVGEDIYVLNFSKEVNITASNVTVQAKKMKNGEYKNNVEVEDLSTSDNKMYTLVTGYGVSLVDGDMLKITVTGVNKTPIVKEVDVYSTVSKKETEDVKLINADKIIEDSWNIEVYSPSDTYATVKSVSGLPEGLKYSLIDGDIVLKGVIGKTGVFTTSFVIEDEKGSTSKLNVVYVAGNDKTITVYCPKKYEGIYENDKYYRTGISTIYIAGGSTSYTVSAYDDAGIFEGSPKRIDSGKYTWYYTTRTIGTATGVFTVQDNESPMTKKTGNAIVETKKSVKVKGKVTSNTGKGVANAFIGFAPPSTDGAYDSVFTITDKDGNYETFIIPETYRIAASINGTYSFAYNQKITADTTLNFKLNVYEVKLKANDPSFDMGLVGDWYSTSTDRYVGERDVLYLKPGTYDIYSTGTTIIGSDYNASAKFTVKSDMTVIADVTATESPIVEIGEGTTHIDGSYQTFYFAFTPTKTHEYHIYTKNTDDGGDPDLTVYEQDGNIVDSDNDSGDVDFYVDLEAGKTYYLVCYDYNAAGYSTDLVITREV